MQTECISGQLEFEGFDGRHVVAAFDGGAVTSDAGALLLRETDRAIRLIERVAACFSDGRDPGQLIHALPTLVGQRIVAIALGYEDVNDHDGLRFDPVLALFGDSLEAKRKDCAPLAGKSTMNRLEHAPGDGCSRYHKIGCDREALQDVFVDVFLDAHGKAPREIVLDLDATDDPLHGHREGRFFHGYYDCHCCLPLYCVLRPSAVGGKTAALEHRRRGRRQGRDGAPRRPHPPALAQGTDPAPRRLRLRPRGADGLVRGAARRF